VPEIKKYSFCKFFDFRHLSEFHGLLAQVFNHFSDTQKNDIADLQECDWLFGARSMHKWPNLRGDSGWKYLGILSASEDSIVPDFKGTNGSPRISEDESKVGRWYAIHNLQGGEDCAYSQVKHLEHMILTVASLGLVCRTGMEYCRLNGLQVKDYYNLDEEGVRSTYWQMINIPIYKDIPKQMRGKSLAKTSQ
jgi:hypothetical protein